MRPLLSALMAFVTPLFRSHLALQWEIVALRYHVAVDQQSVPRPRLQPADRLFWVWRSRLWPGWQAALTFVPPRTVMAWQKKRCREHWRHLSQQGKRGRPAMAKEVRELIQDMGRSNPTWGAPRMVGELRKLGIPVATSTVEQDRPHPRKPPSPTWKACVTNHVKEVVSCDVFTVPTVMCKGLFVCVILAHERRRIVHVHVTEHPTTPWTAQHIVEAFPWDEAPCYLRCDRDRMYGDHCRQRVGNLGIEEVKIAPPSPWQNPSAERLIGSIRRECLNDMIVLHEPPLTRVLHSYVAYDHHWRPHRSLEMDTPLTRPVHGPELGSGHKVAEVGGMHHHYERRAA